MVKLSIDVRQQIVDMFKKGENHCNIARTLNIGRTTIRKVCLKFQETGSVFDKKRSGRPKKLTERDTRILCRTSTQDPFRTARQVIMASGINTTASIRTIQSYLTNCGLPGRIAERKTLISDRNMKRRVTWCKAYNNWDTAQWKYVIFSDECRMEVTSSYRRYVRRPDGHRFDPKYILKNVRFCSKSVLIWGAIKGDGSRILIRCPTRLDSTAYQEVLDEGLQDMYADDSIFMQDGAPCHTSRSTMSYLENKKICLLSDWPPQSPDINVIENMWSTLKRNVSQFNVTSSDDLWNVTLKAWNDIPIETIYNLYKSIPRRLKAVLKAKGHHSKY
jgi:transposase